MVKETNFKGREAFECEVCSFKYAERKVAEECEIFCRTHNSCSMEITKNALR